MSSFLAPTLTADLSPPLFIGVSGEDALKLLCVATAAEDIISATYQFTWIKDNTPLDLSDDRIVVSISYRYTTLCGRITEKEGTRLVIQLKCIPEHNCYINL